MNRTITLFTVILLFILASLFLWEDKANTWAQQLTALTAHPQQYVPLSFLILASDIVLPIPNSIIMYTNGFVLGGALGAALSVISLMTSSSVGYFLGRLTSYGQQAAADNKAAAFLQKYGVLAILITRGIPMLSESICILAGHIRMPFGKYLLMNLLGYIPISLLFAMFGRFGYDENAFLLSLGCSFGIAGLFWWWGRKWVPG